jgi:hypothetical protein
MKGILTVTLLILLSVSIQAQLITFNTLKNGGLYEISVLTSGDCIHDELMEEISENCTFDGLEVGDVLVYACDYTTFAVSSQGGKNAITARHFHHSPRKS